MTGLASGVGERFTVGDVTAQPGLHHAAATFIKNYRGDFEFLVRMKEVYAMTGRFTDGQAAGVCNSMRWDPDGIALFNQIKESEVLPPNPPMVLAPEKRHLQVVPAYTPPASFGVKVIWNLDWLTTERMVRSHRIDPNRSRAVYFRDEHAIDFVVVTLCGVTKRSTARTSRWSRDRSWSLTEQPTKQVCPTCQSKEYLL